MNTIVAVVQCFVLLFLLWFVTYGLRFGHAVVTSIQEQKSEETGKTAWAVTYQKGNFVSVVVNYEPTPYKVGDRVLVMHQPGQVGFETTSWTSLSAIVVLLMHVLVLAALVAYGLALAMPEVIPAWVPGTLLSIPCFMIVMNGVVIRMRG